MIFRIPSKVHFSLKRMDFKALFLSLFVLQHTATANLEPLIDKCCNKGRSWMLAARELCPPYTLSLNDIPTPDRKFCRSVIDVCCLSIRKEKQCISGIQMAKTRNSCDSLNNRVGVDDSKECCNCCQMGLITAQRGLLCLPITQVNDVRCENTFSQCCNSTSTTLSPSPASESMCEKFQGRLCAQVCINTPGSYRCSCRDGYELLSDNRSCQRISTCERNNPCQHQCIDEPTGTRCNCRVGFTLNADNKSCRDINECLQNGMCAEHDICENTPGSFTCRRMLADGRNFHENSSSPCGIGYTFNQHTRQCDDINECAMNRDNCVEGQTCENTIGSFHCRRSMSCGTGYTLDQRSQLCLDDDECTLGTHNCGPAWDCVNIPGSFRCVQKECPYGFRLDSRTGSCDPIVCSSGMKPNPVGNCADINECVEVLNACSPNQECRNSIGSYSCIDLLTCSSGYAPNAAKNACEDVNECDTANHECTGYLMQCVNQPGSYSCQCPIGFRINHNLKTCEDVDECRIQSNICAQNARCENTHGSYRCQCREGFELVGNVCQDIDECSRPGMCHHICRNTWGAFRCECREGFKVAADNRMCEDIDECAQAAENNIKLCLGICENTHGSFSCSCPQGYQLSADRRTCEDVDECLLRTAQCTHPNEICINSRGGYKCQMVTCPNGFTRTTSEGQTSVRCQRNAYICPQGDVDCLYSPISYSTNFITFPTQIRVPADLFTMRGPVTPLRRLTFALDVIKAEDPVTGESRVNKIFFNIKQLQNNEAIIQLLQRIEGPQDIELELKMNIFSKEFQAQNEEVFFATAVAKIFIYVTKDQW